MYPVIEIFGKEFGTYSILAVFGMLLSFFVAFLLSKRYNVEREDFIMLVLCIVAGVLVGSHILFGITNIKYIVILFKNISEFSFSEIISILINCFGGMVFYGGFIGAYIGVLVYTKITKNIERAIALDLLAVAVPLFHVFGRIGCFLGGCCFGREWSWGFTVHGNMLYPAINDVLRIPVQLIEAGCNLAIFLLILILYKKLSRRGILIYIYMIIYPVIRFVLEYFRGDEIRGELFSLSTSQWISIILFVFSIVKLLAIRYRDKHKETAA